jgi:hypothetical protein
MRLSLVRSCVLVLPLLIPVLGQAQEDLHPLTPEALSRPGDAARALGIGRYGVLHAHVEGERGVTIDLFDTGGLPIGVVTIEWDDRSGVQIEVDVAPDWVRILWNGSAGLLRVSRLPSGQTGEKRLGSRGWRVVDGGARFWEGVADAARLGALVLDDYEVNTGHGRRGVEPRSARGRIGLEVGDPDFLLPTGEVPSPRCGGLTVRGDSVSNTRSQCCLSARMEADLLCWNNWCTGCCRFLECDAACGIGDYFCVCGITGYACSPPC